MLHFSLGCLYLKLTVLICSFIELDFFHITVAIIRRLFINLICGGRIPCNLRRLLAYNVAVILSSLQT